jgi:hypothetical protein
LAVSCASLVFDAERAGNVIRKTKEEANARDKTQVQGRYSLVVKETNKTSDIFSCF